MKTEKNMKCRPQCGACCYVLSISSAIPGMPNGKPAMVRCVNLTDDNSCAIFSTGKRPKVCADFKAEPDICGKTRQQAIENLKKLL